MMSGKDCLNEKHFNSRRKVDSELVATTSVGSVFPMCGAATAKARLPTVDSLTGGTTRPRLALVEPNGVFVDQASRRHHSDNKTQMPVVAKSASARGVNQCVK